MKTAFIIHGTGGSPEGNWFPWMKKELEEKGYKVFVPAFPTPNNQSLDSWQEVFEEYKEYIDSETIFIAHSVGPAFVLSILEKINTKISACYFISGFLGNINIESFDRLNDSFVNKIFDWERIRNNSQSFYMCHGSDDPYVPLQNAKSMAGNLDIEIDMLEQGGHLNEESGYTEFEYLFKQIIERTRIKKYEEILSNNIYLSLSTIDEEYGTWISPVFFCRKNNTLYFASQKSSRHIQNIQKDNKVSFSIFDSHAIEGEGNGIQGLAEVREVKGKKLIDALEIYKTDFLTLNDFENEYYSLFKMKIKKVYILDPFSGADIRVEIEFSS